VVVPDPVRRAIADHARKEAPNEACGLLVLRDGVAERYEQGRNALASPYRFELDIDPEIWFLEDDGYELAVVHSHPETEPKPSRTDFERVGLWRGRPYLIYSVALDELRAYALEDGRATELELAAST
jgi:proteasome lid subunit RPN8/RPN11